MFSEIREKIGKVDDQLNDLRVCVLLELAVSGENPLLFKILEACDKVQPEITAIKKSIMDSETEEEEMNRELGEEEQINLEEEYYKEGNSNEE